MITANRYEIENHFQSYDFLKIYSDSILEHDLDMNCVLQLEEINRKNDYDNNVQRSQEEW